MDNIIFLWVSLQLSNSAVTFTIFYTLMIKKELEEACFWTGLINYLTEWGLCIGQLKQSDLLNKGSSPPTTVRRRNFSSSSLFWTFSRGIGQKRFGGGVLSCSGHKHYSMLVTAHAAAVCWKGHSQFVTFYYYTSKLEPKEDNHQVYIKVQQWVVVKRL